MKFNRDEWPQDLERCHALIGELLSDLDQKERKLQRYLNMLTKLLRWRYGPKRERVDEHQLFLFAGAMVAENRDIPPPETSDATPKARPGHGRGELPKHLERRPVIFDLPAEQKQCPQCHKPLRRIGEETSERLEYVPASLYVIQEVSPKYACPGGCTVVTATKPMRPIEKGLPGPGLLAQVVTSKYADHLPLHRQEQIFKRQGVHLSRQTMCDWMGRCAELLAPLLALMKERVLSSKAVQTDDTPVAVLDPDLPRTKTGRIWTYVGDDRHPYTVYDYTPNRSREGPDEFLRAFSGYLQADAYSGYDKLYADPKRDVTEVACWAHVRRKFYDAQDTDLMRSMVMLAYIRLLYEVEREARNLKCDAQARQALRQQKSAAILADIETYLKREQTSVLPKSPIAVAIGYALGNWDALVRYCGDGDLEIDNNGAERALRGVAVGRRNWMFFGSDKGGHTAAVLTSFITTCKRLDIDPVTYLGDIFERLSAHPADRLAELLPDQWAAARTVVTA